MSRLLKRKQLKFKDLEELEVTKVKQTQEQTTQTIETSTSDLSRTIDERHRLLSFKVNDYKLSDFKVSELKQDNSRVGDSKASNIKVSEFKVSEDFKEDNVRAFDSKNSDFKIADFKKDDLKIDDLQFEDLKIDDFKVRDFKASDFLSEDFTPSSVQNSNSQSDSNDTQIGRYVNWSSIHSTLSSLAWCCVGDLINFCNKYEFKVLSLTDAKQHQTICAEVRSLLSGAAPFHMRRRFPGNIHNPENLWVCIGRCPGVEYHLNRILNIFRKPLDRQMTERQREARQNFHLAINELRLDISARISAVKLYDRDVFERGFHLNWLAQ